ncbi:MAG: carboxylesterase/lipase family protein [Novosphingobium sp.]|nr:carboxylesterase/lipase family protein [Novosphingobium sp.]
MGSGRFTRRESMIGGVMGGAFLTLPLAVLAAEGTPTTPVATSAGRIRGLRSGGVSRFLGVRYGADTRPRRFLPPVPPQPWSGMRDCLVMGSQAVQGVVGGRPETAVDMNSEFTKRVLATFKATMEPGPGSEDCLFLNVWTPEASPRGRRPVMVWLHGGGFAIGSAGDAQYDGAALARKGGVVVVTLNHRLNALGYLYLGALDPLFADSGNSGTLDQVLALEWVRDNIAAFGGDPGNVTIFGQSGGGAKVSAMLTVPRAHGLFRRAIIESGPGLRMAERADAAAVAERTLAKLSLAPGDVRKLQTLDVQAVVRASAEAAAETRSPRALSPVVDGRTLPSHPFDPAAPAISRDVPLIVGTNKDEGTLFLAADPGFGKMTADEAKARFVRILGPRGEAAFEAYRAAHPSDPPTYWVSALMSDVPTRMDSIRIAERKAAQHGAPVFMYRFDWTMPTLGGVMRTPHGLEVPLVFDNPDKAPLLLGTGPEPRHLADVFSQAWIDFARNGDPSQPGLAWPSYDPVRRLTMIFDVHSHVVSDPDAALRRFWEA